MKYIKTIDENGKYEIFLFSNDIHHDAYAETVSRIKDKTFGSWKRIYREPVSAGFVSIDLTCYGNSESLGLESSPEDTEILRKQFNK